MQNQICSQTAVKKQNHFFTCQQKENPNSEASMKQQPTPKFKVVTKRTQMRSNSERERERGRGRDRRA